MIAVIGSSAPDLTESQTHLPYCVGQWIATAQYHLLTGGGPGVMAAANEGFCSVPSRAGISIGVIPDGKASTIYPNKWVELPIFTHLKGENPKGEASRNHINVRSAHAVVAFPGGAGTRAEVELGVEQDKSCPVVACVSENEMIGGLGVDALRHRGVVIVNDLDGITRFLSKRLTSPMFSGLQY